MLISGTRSTSHGIGLRVPADSTVVDVQQCLEAWAFSDEFCGLMDPPSVLSLYLLTARRPDTDRALSQRSDAVALSPDAPTSACCLHASYPRVTWDWDTVLVPTFADPTSLDIRYSVQAVGMHLGGALGASQASTAPSSVIVMPCCLQKKPMLCMPAHFSMGISAVLECCGV